MTDKPSLWITRKLMAETEARASRDYNVTLNPDDTPFTQQELIERSSEFDAILPCHTEHFTAETTAALSDRVKIIANHSVGVDHCDLDALKSRGITVTNTPDVLSKATAETALTCMLGAARRASEGDRMIRNGKWDFWGMMFMVGTQMTDKRLGIIGMGRVGQAFHHLISGFDMEVHYYNRSRLPAAKENGAIYHETVESLLPEVDFLSLHCPATPDTENLLNKDTLALLPKGAIVVNTARGALIDEDALYDALSDGHLGAAGLDVFKQEPGGNPKLSTLVNIFMLPHIGSATKETRIAMGYRALDNLDAFFAGKEPKDRLV